MWPFKKSDKEIINQAVADKINQLDIEMGPRGRVVYKGSGVKLPLPNPPLLRVGCNDQPCPLCGSGMKPNWLWFKRKGCYQPLCENYWKADK